MRNTPGVEPEPETHRRDREAMLAEHAAVARRVQAEVDGAVAAAAAERRAYFDDFVASLRTNAQLQRDHERILKSLTEAPVAGGASELDRANARDTRRAGDGGGSTLSPLSPARRPRL
jgi:hypothetical protein